MDLFWYLLRAQNLLATANPQMLISIPKLKLLNLSVHLVLKMVNAYHRLVSLRMLLSSCISLEFVNYVLVYVILNRVFIHDEVIEFASNVFTVTHQLVAETAE